MEPHVNVIDYLFSGLIIAAAVFCMRVLLKNIRFLSKELGAPMFLDPALLPDRRRSFFLMVLWTILAAFFLGTAVVLFSRPGTIISGNYSPDMYGWLAGLIMLTTGVACIMLVYRYYLLWSRLKR
jgi:hypothetical protein